MLPIVYIDDGPLLCRVFQRILEDAKWPVVTFSDPEAAVVYLATNPVAAIVCDYRMPAMSGLQLLERIASTAPFFLVSGDLAVSALAREMPRVAGVLNKPFQPERLLELVSEHVG